MGQIDVIIIISTFYFCLRTDFLWKNDGPGVSVCQLQSVEVCFGYERHASILFGEHYVNRHISGTSNHCGTWSSLLKQVIFNLKHFILFFYWCFYSYNLRQSSSMKAANKFSNISVIGVFLITIINVLISTFNGTNLGGSDITTKAPTGLASTTEPYHQAVPIESATNY